MFIWVSNIRAIFNKIVELIRNISILSIIFIYNYKTKI